MDNLTANNNNNNSSSANANISQGGGEDLNVPQQADGDSLVVNHDVGVVFVTNVSESDVVLPALDGAAIAAALNASADVVTNSIQHQQDTALARPPGIEGGPSLMLMMMTTPEETAALVPIAPKPAAAIEAQQLLTAQNPVEPLDPKPSAQQDDASNAAQWEAKFCRLEAFRAQHGHVNVTASRSSKKKKGTGEAAAAAAAAAEAMDSTTSEAVLYRWVRQQRDLYKNKKLDPSRHERLEALGFSWTAVRSKKGINNSGDSPTASSSNRGKQSEIWQAHYEKLKQYEAIHHNKCCVPRDYPDDPALAHFVSNQRKIYRSSKLPADRKVQLDQIGFTWTIKEHRTWEDNYERLKDYKKQHNGSTNVPCRYKADLALGSFVNFQRRKYREGKLSSEHQERLKALGFQFEVPTEAQLRRKETRPALMEVEQAHVTATNEKKWEDMFAALQGYKAEHGRK